MVSMVWLEAFLTRSLSLRGIIEVVALNRNDNATGIYALKGRNTKAQGAALGNWSVRVSQALKGRHRLTGLISRSFRATGLRVVFLPRAAPWAFTFDPFRAARQFTGLRRTASNCITPLDERAMKWL